jgi:nucleoside-diphosphate-sugar epimerase
VSGRALVTGATGMLGAYLLETLQGRGWRVRALVRSPSTLPGLQERGVEVALGDLEDAPSLSDAARGCDVVLHAAAAIGSDAEWDRFRRVNVQGTANVVEAARRAGARLVHVSSTAVYGGARYGSRPTDELTPLPDLPEADAYGRSKQEAEQIVLNACSSGLIWGTVVRPPVMYGSGDRQFAPRVGPVLEHGVFPLIDGGLARLTLVHARNVAEGAVLAASVEAARGRVFLLADDYPTTVVDLVRGAEKGLQRRIRSPRVPLALGRAGFALLAITLRTVGRSDLARHAGGTLEMLTRDNPFTSRRARTELGWQPSVRPETGLPEAFRWWKATYRSDETGGT